MSVTRLLQQRENVTLYGTNNDEGNDTQNIGFNVQRLPEEVMLEIFNKCTPKELGCCLQVCKKWYGIITSPYYSRTLWAANVLTKPDWRMVLKDQVAQTKEIEELKKQHSNVVVTSKWQMILLKVAVVALAILFAGAAITITALTCGIVAVIMIVAFVCLLLLAALIIRIFSLHQ